MFAVGFKQLLGQWPMLGAGRPRRKNWLESRAANLKTSATEVPDVE